MRMTKEVQPTTQPNTQGSSALRLRCQLHCLGGYSVPQKQGAGAETVIPASSPQSTGSLTPPNPLKGVQGAPFGRAETLSLKDHG
jgi:hypothetical protein